MPVNAFDLNTIGNYYYFVGTNLFFTPGLNDPYGFGSLAGYFNMGNYRNFQYWTPSGPANFPGANMSLEGFFGTSPVNEWGGGGGDGGSCFLAGSRVLMADGTHRDIEDIVVGDFVQGRWSTNEVKWLGRPYLGRRAMYFINGKYHNTGEHVIWTDRGWTVLDKTLYLTDDYHQWMEVIVEDGSVQKEFYHGISPHEVQPLYLGDMIAVEDGFEQVTSIESRLMDKATQLYNLGTDGDRTMYVNGLVVGAWANDTEVAYYQYIGT